MVANETVLKAGLFFVIYKDFTHQQSHFSVTEQFTTAIDVMELKQSVVSIHARA